MTNKSNVSADERITLNPAAVVTYDKEIVGASVVDLRPDSFFINVHFWILGLVNNFGYVIVFSAIKSIVNDDFDLPHFAGIVQWANVVLGIGTKLINISFLLETSFLKRMIATFIIMLIGSLLTMFALKFSFPLTLVGILCIGTSSALGESVLLGYLKRFHPDVAGSWSSGTGGAGLFGALSFVGFKSILKLDNFTTFSILTPLAMIYFCSFLILYFKYDQFTNNTQEKNVEIDQNDGSTMLSDEHVINTTYSSYKPSDDVFYNDVPTSILTDTEQTADFPVGTPIKDLPPVNVSAHTKLPSSRRHVQQHYNYSDSDDDEDSTSILAKTGSTYGSDVYTGTSISTSSDNTLNCAGDNSQYDIDDPKYRASLSTCERLQLVLPATLPPSIQIFLIYFLEYCIYVTFAVCANPKAKESSEFAVKYSYEILCTCYQLGVYISRSSIRCIRFKQFNFLVILQGISFIAWFFNSYYHFLSIFAQFFWMIFVGLCAGFLYVNVFYSLLREEKYAPDREFSVNVVSFFVTMGITMSSFFSILALNTFLKQ